jgi:hypothetical protein
MRMWALPLFLWNALRTIHSSLGLKREVLGLAVTYLLLRFYGLARDYLLAQGFPELPDVHGAWIAAAFAGIYLLWNLLRHATELEHKARPKLALKILDPSQRYDTYVTIGERLLRLYHLEVENHSRSRTARRVAVTLESYQQSGDKKLVEIRSKLKIANAEAEDIDLKPLARVVFELCGVAVNGSGASPTAEAREDQTFSILPVGSGTIRIVAVSDDAPAIEGRYTLYIDTAGKMTIKPQTNG